MYREVIRDDSSPVLIDGVRTPTGSLTGQLSDYSAVELATTCLKVMGEKIDPREVDEVILGSVIQAGQGQAPARQVLLGADWSPKIPAVTINKVCGSGIKSILQAVEAIRGGAPDNVIAGGVESMSNAPHLLTDYRNGKKLGDGELVDSAVHDGLWCSIGEEHMGAAAERIADRYGLSRDQLDEYALNSHQRATQAEDRDCFQSERIDYPEIDRDEPVREDTSLEQLGELKPAFDEDGVVTAGNAPGLNDGASVVAVTHERRIESFIREDFRWEDAFEIEGYAVVGEDPGNLFETPAGAIEMLLEVSDWSLDDFDRIEINEAFASQVLANCHRLELNPERINQWGGAIALGHPIGMSGNRIVLTLMNQLRQTDGELGLASICMGGGNGIAMVIKRVPFSP
ncbi:MAG: acetyl-CoA C-acyltransferase [bacterium]